MSPTFSPYLRRISFGAKLLALLLLGSLFMPGVEILGKWGLHVSSINQIPSFSIVLFTLGFLIEVVSGGTPILKMWFFELRKAVFQSVEVGDVRSYVRNIFREGLFAYFGASLMWVATGGPILRRIGMSLGAIIMLYHLASLVLLLFRPDLMQICLHAKGIVYYDSSWEEITWEEVKEVEFQEKGFKVLVEHDTHEFDFAKEKEDFVEISLGLKNLLEIKGIPFKGN